MVFGLIKKAVQKFDTAIANVGSTKIGTKIRESVSPTTAAKISDIANKALTILTSPIQSISNFTKAQKETKEKGATRLIAEGAEVALIASVPFSASGKTAVAKVAAASVSSVPKAALTLTGIGAVAASPTIREVVATAVSPVNLITTGAKVGEKVEAIIDPVQKEGASKLATGVALGLGGLALAGAAAVAIPKVAEFIDERKAEKELVQTPSPTEQIIKTDGGTPPVQEVQTLKAGTTPTKRRKRKSKVKQKEGVRVVQKVNVAVSNINRKVYKQAVIV